MNYVSNHHRQWPLSLALTAVIASLCACHVDAHSVKAKPTVAAPGYRLAIPNAYKQMTAAFAANHLDRGNLLVTNDYRQVDPQGNTLDKNGCRMKFQSERDSIRTIQSQMSIGRMTVTPAGVQVQMAMHSAGTGVKKVLFVHIKGTFINDMRVSDLWVNTHDGWRLKSRLLLRDDSKLHAG